MRVYILLILLIGCVPETEIWVDGREIHQEYIKCEIEVYTMVDGVEFFECIN